MSRNLPSISGKEAIKAFEKIGYKIVRQKGSHIRMKDEINQNHKPMTISNHSTLKSKLLRRLIRDASLTVDEFRKLL